MFLRLYKPLLGILAVFIAVWAAVVIWWRASNRMPDSVDVVTGFVALPIVLLLGFWILRKLIETMRAGQNENGRVLSDPLASSGSAPSPEPQRIIPHSLQIIKASVRTPVGADLADTWTFLSEGQSKQDLDGELLASEGISAFVAKLSDVDTSSSEMLFAESQGHGAAPEWHPSQRRVVQMVSEVVEDLQDECIRYLSKRTGTTGSKPRLSVRAHVSQRWDSPHCVWFAAHLRRILAGVMAPELIAVSVVPTYRSIDVLRTMDEVNLELNARRSDDLIMVLAADSLVDTDFVAAAHAEGKLLGSSSKGDIVPGEAAAGLLLCAVDKQGTEVNEDASVIGRLLVGRREQPVNSARLPDFEALSDMFNSAPGIFQRSEDQVVGVVSDADRRVSVQTEVMRFINAALPHIESPSHCVAAAMATGYCPVAGGLVAIAMAHSKSVAEQKSVLLVSVEDRLDRGIVMVDPLVVSNSESTQSL